MHVVLDKEMCPLCDETIQHRQGCRHVIVWVDALADVVQQGGQQKLYVVGPMFLGQFENL